MPHRITFGVHIHVRDPVAPKQHPVRSLLRRRGGHRCGSEEVSSQSVPISKVYLHRTRAYNRPFIRDNEKAPASMAKPTVLIVDDDREVTQYLSDVFKSDGWKVLTEKDGDWALKTFKSRRIDAVVLDILIPVLNGFQVAEAIRGDPRGKDLPIIIMSGIYQGAENRKEAIERYGLLEYLNKPVEGERIRRLLRDSLSAKETAQQRHRTGQRKRISRPRQPAVAKVRRDRQPGERVAQALARTPVSLRGSLVDTPFARLLHELYKLQSSGALYLMHDNVKKIVFLEGGQPIFVKSNMVRECLGQILVQQGRLSPDQCDASVATARANKKLQGAVLVEMGVLTAPELQEALASQLESKLLEIFSWEAGEYQFKENARLPKSAVRTRSSCATLIVRGLCEHYRTDRLEREVASSLSAFAAPATDPYLRFQQLELPDGVEPVAEALDGKRTLLRVIEQTPTERTLGQQVVLGLYYAGVVDLFDRPVERPAVRSESRRAELFGAGAVPSPDDPTLEEYLAAELMKLKKLDHFRVLNLSRSATTSDVEVAFDGCAWRYHPDRFGWSRGQVGELAEGVFNRLRAAYLVLRSPFRRESYLEQLSDATGGAQGSGRTSAAEAEKELSVGGEHLDAGRYEKASWHLRRAVDLDEGSAQAHALLAWAVHKDSPMDHVATVEAHRLLERALRLDAELDVAHQFLGHLHLEADEADLARDHFERALRANPDNTDAAEQLKTLG